MDKKPKYYLNPENEFVIENYNFAKPFANFFPGIAGAYGIPMWVFYVNRGQAIASFGTRDKDHAILEFQPANKAWYLTHALGFRTFIKAYSGKQFVFYEPFHNGVCNAGFDLSNRMLTSSCGLKIEESCATLGLKISVDYFTIPQDSYAALVRCVTVGNTGKKARSVELLDGLPQIVPYGTSNLFLKKLSRTIEAWMDVDNLERSAPFYKLDVDPTDRPQVLHIEKGNFYLGFCMEKGKPKLIKPIVDPQAIFGSVNDFSSPREFLARRSFTQPKNQVTKNKTPCGFVLLGLELPAGSERTFYSLVGNMRNLEALNASIGRIADPGYLLKKRDENRAVLEELETDIDTRSSSREFDLYVKQTYIDNIMRGGYPVIFKGSPGAFYMYSRKHGDLERDYNKFQIQATYFSQGNGNYRDINQNRRNDAWFNPEVGDENIVTFLSLIQADGYNPLVVKGVKFEVAEVERMKASLREAVSEQDAEKIAAFLAKPFSPGELIFFLEENKIRPHASYDELLAGILSFASKIQDAEHGEGFWTDHWAYNLDLLERYLALYPEKLREIVFEKKAFTFYDNTEVVKPRSRKYVRKDGALRQYHSVGYDESKKEMIMARAGRPHLVRGGYGRGEVYSTTLFNKLLCVLVNKLASLDPFGVGVEMEADKPNWFDALNGLPALFGSSSCETFELKRLALFMLEALERARVETLEITEEILAFLVELNTLLKEHAAASGDGRDFYYWDKSAELKESYREKTKAGFSGKEMQIHAHAVVNALQNALRKIDAGLGKAFNDNDGTFSSYFINEVAAYEPLDNGFIKPTRFTRKALPLFLEGQVHALRLAGNAEDALSIHKATRQSALYDKALKMYKVTADLKDCPEEVGRCRVFTPGWLENESIWLHMEYKYLLEMLKQGLFAEFFQEFKDALIPFQKPAVYGRSILENVSFVVSSAYPDKSLHGNGFVARLSGSTAELIHIWLLMNAGLQPFFLDENNALNLRLSPVLPGWLFDKKGEYSFNFLSATRVFYHNPQRKDTFGPGGVSVKRTVFHDTSGSPVELPSAVIPSPYALQVRSGRISCIDVYF